MKNKSIRKLRRLSDAFDFKKGTEKIMTYENRIF